MNKGYGDIIIEKAINEYIEDGHVSRSIMDEMKKAKEMGVLTGLNQNRFDATIETLKQWSPEFDKMIAEQRKDVKTGDLVSLINETALRMGAKKSGMRVTADFVTKYPGNSDVCGIWTYEENTPRVELPQKESNVKYQTA